MLGDLVTVTNITPHRRHLLHNVEQLLHNVNANCQYLVIYLDANSINKNTIEFCSTVSDSTGCNEKRLGFKACFMMQVSSEIN